MSFISAVPQVIFSDLNVTIWSNLTGNVTTGSYQILSEGLNAQTTFPIIGNCSFYYQRNIIPITFSREFQQNDSDIATLIHALAINNNITYQWQECERNLSICSNDVGYKGNYTQTKNDLDVCYRARDDYSKQVSDLNEQIKTLTTWRNMGCAAGIIGIGLAIYFYRKQAIKKINNPYNEVSGVARQY